MRLVVVNFAMDADSPVLAWQVEVVNALAAHCERVVVLTERVGRYEAPANVTVYHLNCRPAGIPYRLGGSLIVLWQCSSLMHEHRVNACFVHMNHRWSYRLYPALKLRRIPILLWYAHGTVTPSLAWALACADRVVTSTPEGFRIASPKVRVIGQGIDTTLFQIPPFAPTRRDLVYVGRISRRKRIDVLLHAQAELNRLAPGHGLSLRLVGPLLTADDRAYRQELNTQCAALNLNRDVEFLGELPPRQLPKLYATACLHVNASQTGSLDKAVLEALACGCPVLTTNIAFASFLRERPEFYLNRQDPGAFAERIISITNNLADYDPRTLRRMIEGQHDLATFTAKILAHLETIKK